LDFLSNLILTRPFVVFSPAIIGLYSPNIAVGKRVCVFYEYFYKMNILSNSSLVTPPEASSAIFRLSVAPQGQPPSFLTYNNAVILAVQTVSNFSLTLSFGFRSHGSTSIAFCFPPSSFISRGKRSENPQLMPFYPLVRSFTSTPEVAIACTLGDSLLFQTPHRFLLPAMVCAGGTLLKRRTCLATQFL